MKLTERQVLLKKTFHKYIINLWGKDKKIANVIIMMAFELDGIYSNDKNDYSIFYPIQDELESIPSIGHLSYAQPIKSWLAITYPEISNHMFNNGDKELALKAFSKFKPQKSNSLTRKRSKDDLKEYQKHKWNLKKINAYHELHNNNHGSKSYGDARSDWNIVK